MPAVSHRARQAVALLGFVTYSGGLVAFVEASTTGTRLVAALIGTGGLMAAGWVRWGMTRE